MNYLEHRIITEGIVIEESILKVNHFLNQQIDPSLLRFVAESFSLYFKDHNINKILTIEASGIAFAVVTALAMNDLPLVFAKKGSSKLSGDDFQSKVYSFTKKQHYQIGIDKRLLNKEDRVLLIDDFLADGNAVLGLLELCNQAKAEVVGIGIVIEKSFQAGRKILDEQGWDVYSLARIKSLKNNIVELQ